MTPSSRRAVLTGLGVVTPIGMDAPAFWAGLRDGRSGVRTIQSFDASALPTRFGGEIRDFNVWNYVDKKDRKLLKSMPRTIQLAVAGAALALTDANVDKKQLDPTRFGVIFGAGTIPNAPVELGPAARASADWQAVRVDLRKWGEQGIPCIPPMWMLSYVPNMPACCVSILHNAQGPNNSITVTGAASLLAIGEASRLIARDKGDIFLVGGADTRLTPIGLVRQSLFAPLSRRNDAPEKASRPFDRGRDGLVPGEGAGILVLEELQHALRRGARILAEVVGFGAAFDPDRSGRGLARAIRAALNEAGLAPDAIDHVNAQGMSTWEGDAWEARGIQEVFGACSEPPPVFAPRSYFGDLGAGSAAVELAASVLALTHGQLPASLNYDEPDPECPIRMSVVSRGVERPCFVKISFTELGQCAALVCRKWL